MLRSRGGRARLLMLVGLATSVAALLCAGSAAEARQVPASIAVKRAMAAAVTVRVNVAYKNRPLTVPGSFLGISTEYYTIPVLAAHLGALKSVFSLLTQNGPVVLRIGGDSADVALPPSRQAAPTWAIELTPSWLAQTSAIVKALHVKLILDLNTVTASATAVATWAKIAEQSLPRGSIVGFEIGNEPDIYDPLTLTDQGVTGPLPPSLTAKAYAAAYLTYDRTLDRVIPKAPLLGPALAYPNVSWVKTLLAAPHGGLTAITVHRYPLSACAHFGPTVPTIARLLSETTTAGMAATLKPAITAAARSHLPVRVTELNSVTCGGTSGVSNTFATALWAPDALMELIQAGVASADIHVRTAAINTAFSFTKAGLVAYPLLYGLVTYARTLGSHPRLLPVHVTEPAHIPDPPPVDLKTWAVLDGNQLRVLLIDKSGRAANAKLTLPAVGAVTVQRLLARAPTATTGVTLAGQTLGANGQWTGALVQKTVTPAGGTYAISVPGTSAAILTAKVRPGTT